MCVLQERIQFSTEQTTQLLAARATLLNRARTIFGERQSIISAIQVRQLLERLVAHQSK